MPETSGGLEVVSRTGQIRPARAACALALVAVALFARNSEAQTNQIVNRATVSYEWGNGQGTQDSASAVVRKEGVVEGVEVSKRVDRSTAAVGDTLTYTVTVRNTGNRDLSGATLTDTLPAGLELVASSRAGGGGAVTSAQQGGRWILKLSLDGLAKGQAATMTARARITSGGQLSNTAVVSGTVQGASTPAVTSAEALNVGIDKKALNTEARAGDTVRYVITIANISANATARNLVLTDTLESGLTYVGASGNPAVNGQILTWQIDSLKPGQSVADTISARANATAAGRDIVNTATVSGYGNEASATAKANPIQILAAAAARITLEKRSGVLEASLGEAVPYTLIVKNEGDAPALNIELTDLLPEGMEIAKSGVYGASRWERKGRQILMFIDRLEAGQADTLRYAVTLLRGSNGRKLTNIAWGKTGGQKIDSAKAEIRIRSGYVLQSQIITGKVWIDSDSSGRQRNEAGVEFARIITAEGEEIRTDRFGRFSLQAVRGGRHTLRLDLRSLPQGFHLAAGEMELRTVTVDGWSPASAQWRVIGNATIQKVIKADTAAATKLTTPDKPLRLIAPANGAILNTNKLYVGAAGPAGDTVKLFDGEQEIASGVFRIDGIVDFVSVDISDGPHSLKITSKDSWGMTRADSVQVHHTGRAVTIEPLERTDSRWIARAGERTTFKAQVLDSWGQPVAAGTLVTVETTGRLEVETADADPTSVGTQAAVGTHGLVTFETRNPAATGLASIGLLADTAKAETRVDILPSLRSFTLTGRAETGFGASGETFAVATGQGRVGKEASLSVSIDSRRKKSNDDFFARGIDTYAENYYPLAGDSSKSHINAAANGPVAVRLEDKRNWLGYGDVNGTSFKSDGIFRYDRSITGLSGYGEKGRASASGFASLTRQSAIERQFRGENSSGPFQVGRIRRGTERVRVETRAVTNTAYPISQTVLERNVEYDVDYEQGFILLRRALPPADIYGNPVYLVISAESEENVSSSTTAGGRVQLASKPTKSGSSVVAGASYVRDGNAALGSGLGAAITNPGNGILNMAGADIKVSNSLGYAEGEVAHGSLLGMSATALKAGAAVGNSRGTGAAFTVMRVNGTLPTPVNTRLSVEQTDIRANAGVAIGKSSLVGAGYQRQDFPSLGIVRETYTAHADERVGAMTFRQEAGILKAQQDSIGITNASSGTWATARLSAANGTTSTWVEGRKVIETLGQNPGGDAIGLGATAKVWKSLTAETSHQIAVGDKWEGKKYSVSAIGVGVATPFGGRARGRVEQSGAGERALTLGWNEGFTLFNSLRVSGMAERRRSVDAAPLTDPVRAAPFVQSDRDRTSLSLAARWVDAQTGRAVEAQSEWRTGDERRRRTGLSVDLPLGRDAGFLARSDRVEQAAAGRDMTRLERSYVAFALRPAGSDVLNSIVKVEHRNSENHLLPTSGVQPESERVIIMTESVLRALPMLTLSARYAFRWTAPDAGDISHPVTSTRAQFGALGAELGLWKNFSARAGVRGLRDQTSGQSSYSTAAALVAGLGPLEVEGGWREGALVDGDFVGSGGKGAYVTLGIRLTEDLIKSPLGFWRARLAGER